MKQAIKLFQTSRHLLIVLMILGITSVTFSQTQYYDASQFPLIGKITEDTETRYERLPTYLQSVTRTPVWQLGKNTSGLALRFRSNTTRVSARWSLLGDVSMNHMTDTGIKGLDLYAWNGEKWQFVNTGRPTAKENEKVIISNMVSQEREYLLYLPLYDGITDLSIGIDSSAYIAAPKLAYPVTVKPIICYGTSITQGGCATRAGMSYTNILGRWLNREVINLGFSGNGQLDYEIADLMSQRTDAALFVLDFIPNVNLEQIRKKTATFTEKLRRQNNQIPILFVESVMFPHSAFDQHSCNIVADKNRALKEEFDKLIQNGYDNIFYLSSEKLIGIDGEATVDGIHLTDLG
ncbi:MAG: SGNH/GDSL hydrolase family protein, partial [Proteiniphilum sp.]|nr:SGNH/GDSL hydrolase family protein [Proteiniphilum sp.]